MGLLNSAGSAIGLDAIFGRVAAATGTRYLALLTVSLTAASTLASVTEYGATGYARQVITPGASTGSGPRTQTHTNALTFGPLSGATGAVIITSWLICDALSGTAGIVMAQGDFTSSRTPAAGDSLTVSVGGISWSIN